MLPVRRTEIDRAAQVLADAFLDDPFTVWLFPSDGLRDRLVESWTRQLRVVYVPKGHTYATPDLAAVAAWSTPGHYRATAVQQIRLFLPYLRLLGPQRLRPAAQAFTVIDGAHPSEPHWYLSAIGVSPSQQRRGLGASLIEPMLGRADGEGISTYLETFRERNVPYYERFGFRLTAEAKIPDGPPMWSMHRPVAQHP